MQSDIVQRLQPILRRNGWGNVQEYARHIPFMLEREGLTIVEAAEITRLTEALRAAEEQVKGLREALEPFVAARLLIGGEIIGLERWHFDRARAALKDQPHD